jgi:hypothetical protein
MKIIMVVIIVAGVVIGCSKDREQQFDLDAALAGIQVDAAPERPAQHACPEPEPCPECAKPDAIFYTVLARVIRGDTESFITSAFMHRGSRWYVMARIAPSGPVQVGPDLQEAAGDGDLLLARVRQQPQAVGRVTIGGSEYEQYGRLLISQMSAPIGGIRGGTAHIFTVFNALE